MKDHFLMPDPQLSTQPADPTYTKLLEVDEDLAAQAAELMAQLEAIEEKRKGLKTVMELFSSADTPITETAIEPVAEVVTAPQPKPSSPISPTEPPAAPAPPQAPKQTSRPARRRRATQPASKTKTTKQPGWQPYIRAEFGQTSLADLVTKILKREPVDYFGIPMMMQAIFVDEMPKSVWTQARNRVSNILAEGVRQNKWYRDQAGQYSLSPAAMESSLL